MIDAAKLAEELRVEQEHTAHAEHARKMADALIKDLQMKVLLNIAGLFTVKMAQSISPNFYLVTQMTGHC